MKNKKFLPLLMAAVMVSAFAFAGCGDGTKPDDGDKEPGEIQKPDDKDPGVTSIAAPVITLDGTTISWSAVENADGYDVEWVKGTDTRKVSTAQTSLTYDIAAANLTEAGTYSFTVTAVNGTLNLRSSQSNAVEYVVEAPLTSTKLTGKVYVVGDSTVSSFDDAYYLPRFGYGTQLASYLNCDASQVVNLALSGRSSLSFLTESNYATLKNGISAGDYLIIGFGHNDEKSDEAARYTDANGVWNEATTSNGPSFAYTLYENYVKLAKDKGATPVLCTPIVRYDAAGAYTGAKVHDTTASDKAGKGGDYSAAIIALGAATDTAVIDLTTITKNIYKADNAAAAYYHAHTTYEGVKGEGETPTGRDDTHINYYGARMVAYEFANALKNTDCELKNHLNLEAVAPTLAVDYEAAKNANYTKSDYKPFVPANNAANKLVTLSGVDWYKTAFGDVTNVNSFTVSSADNKITVSNTDGKGKIAGSADGLAAAFIQIPISKNFTATATVTINGKASSANNQSVFGMMLRDDIYVNEVSKAINSNYVLAGALGDGTSAIFSRESTSLKKSSRSTTVEVGSTYTVGITRVGQTVTVTFNDYTATYTDFDFVAVDNDYMYLCLVGNRGLTVEYGNISFEITGEAQGA